MNGSCDQRFLSDAIELIVRERTFRKNISRLIILCYFVVAEETSQTEGLKFCAVKREKIPRDIIYLKCL